MTPLADALAALDAAPRTRATRTTIAATVSSCRFFRRGRRRWVDLRVHGERDPGGGLAQLVVRWFNAHPGMVKRFPRGGQVVLSGPLSRRGSAAEMANPDVVSVAAPDGDSDGAARSNGPRIIPRYGDVPGVPAATLRKACRAAAALADAVPDGVPAAIARRLDMPPLGEALRVLHEPPPDLPEAEVAALTAGTSRWHRRLAVDELFILALAVARRRRAHRAHSALPCPAAAGLTRAIEAALPFALTADQRAAIAQIGDDLAGGAPMSRLLQGDVGAGKTAVAFAAVAQAVRAGYQAAVMAPTAILAEQHAATLAPWCATLGLNLARVTAATPRAERARIEAAVAAPESPPAESLDPSLDGSVNESLDLSSDGSIDESLDPSSDGSVNVVVGTHALLSEGLAFDRLALVVIDEQHRFGVAQRAALRAKGRAPHLLVMTATPIPRSLALTVYGDLDVTTLTALPPGRTPPQTRVLSGARGRDQCVRALERCVAGGDRAFVVCPLIEPAAVGDTRAGWADVTTTAAALAPRLGADRIGVVHGRMPQAERDAVMDRFRTGELPVVVATTVIEVGVDVPEATLMVIFDAHRFGLAQLHQLRGRVGRGGGDAHCLLMTAGRKTPDGARRLAIMSETTDGFRIAEEDLAIRGPGELIGVKQAGLPKLRFGDLRAHAALLAVARAEAEALLAADPTLSDPAHADCRQVLAARAPAAHYTDSG